MKNYDIIVIGGGHAGVEAAAAAARMGASVALISHRSHTIGALSCNPAIGGLGKGHLVREIDALDGVMGRAADDAAIQFRTLNRSKGPAVQGPRVQVDRDRYKAAVDQILRLTPNLQIIEGECEAFKLEGRVLVGISTSSGADFRCKAAVLTSGTFLNGVLCVGENRSAGGRMGDPAVTKLSHQIAGLGFEVGRLKTGTPPRLCGSTINFDALEPQWGDTNAQFLSFLTTTGRCPQIPCYVTRTNELTHKVIGENLHKTAVYSGAITGPGPRYCPSIEDKVVRFPDRTGHQIFLEPEGLDMSRIYPNGVSTSLPKDLQVCLIRSILGLENALITQFGYAIEYDFVSPLQLQPTLMTRLVDGVFFAGQINGTTGYEEAAAQGIVAGVNAALYVGSQAEKIFDRSESYTGVLVDDLVTRGVSEPYRIFTSRAEYRLRLRADNADERLTSIGVDLGVVGAARRGIYNEKARRIADARRGLSSMFATARELQAVGIEVSDGSGAKRSAFEWAMRSEVSLGDLSKFWPEIHSINLNVLERLDADAKYAIYVSRQEIDVSRHRLDEGLIVPVDMDFQSICGLSSEMKQKLARHRPSTIGQAGRIEGVTPAALMLLAVHAKRMTQ